MIALYRLRGVYLCKQSAWYNLSFVKDDDRLQNEFELLQINNNTQRYYAVPCGVLLSCSKNAISVFIEEKWPPLFEKVLGLYKIGLCT